MKYKYILFDLDGTLTDPKEGITKSVEYALNKMGIKDVDLDELIKFIGPPLKDSFIKYYNYSEDEANQAIEYYREYFKEKGMFENILYDDIDELLSILKDKDKIIAVATSKPTVFADTIINHFNLSKYFNCIVGSNLDGTRTKKADVIDAVLKELDVKSKEEVVMIGDREHDVIGARQIGIDSIGVEYGYGSREELESSGANYIVERVGDLIKLLI